MKPNELKVLLLERKDTEEFGWGKAIEFSISNGLIFKIGFDFFI